MRSRLLLLTTANCWLSHTALSSDASALAPFAKQDRRHDVRHYRAKAGTTVAQQLVIVAALARKQIEQDPRVGSPRLGLLAEIQGLRSWRVNGFSLVWLYLEREDHLDVIRLLGERQDILSTLGDAR